MPAKVTLPWLMPICVLVFLCLPSAAQKIVGQTDGNPFFDAYKTPYETPPFDRIRVVHYLPAVQEGIKRQQTEIDVIVTESQAGHFPEYAGGPGHVGPISGTGDQCLLQQLEAITSPEMEDVAKEIAPLLSTHQDNIALNGMLFARVKAVYDQRAKLKLTPCRIIPAGEHLPRFRPRRRAARRETKSAHARYQPRAFPADAEIQRERTGRNQWLIYRHRQQD